MDLRTGTCPQCQGTAVHVIDGSTLTGANRIPVSAFGHASLNRYICADCGFTQEWMEDPEDRRRIAKKWPAVRPDNERR
ncbi:MAG TPA: hypothetical protein VGE07_15120 [Herpetosiphonaceae bacterium]